jgi:hypothetical protein
MKSQTKGAAKRLIFSLLLACGLGGCAVYEPAYAPYESSYPYGGPAYVYPPVALDLGFTYYDRGPFYYGGPRYYGGSRYYGGARWGNHRGFGYHRH